jgi:tRNA-dihydrouridine synthase
MRERGQFLLDYIDLLLHEGEGEAEGFRHIATINRESNPSRHDSAARGRDRWVVNKVRALGTWYTKGFENGSHLRTAINQCDSIGRLREIVETFFFEGAASFDALRTSAGSADAGQRPAGALAAEG